MGETVPYLDTWTSCKHIFIPEKSVTRVMIFALNPPSAWVTFMPREQYCCLPNKSIHLPNPMQTVLMLPKNNCITYFILMCHAYFQSDAFLQPRQVSAELRSDEDAKNRQGTNSTTRSLQ